MMIKMTINAGDVTMTTQLWRDHMKSDILTRCQFYSLSYSRPLCKKMYVPISLHSWLLSSPSFWPGKPRRSLQGAPPCSEQRITMDLEVPQLKKPIRLRAVLCNVMLSLISSEELWTNCICHRENVKDTVNIMADTSPVIKSCVYCISIQSDMRWIADK